ncbi:hypothetical protein Pla163_37460 [Planctomycetes bacterium Pla163]|uniref:Uncharacterized protein n=1 Tax=Rohdeia mirabilis TaxID=2528008 RepID=A0A518D544_9BACT|nr:hypothetical protein Pla163_37460 [Planctomycetes bacterium Pla163]
MARSILTLLAQVGVFGAVVVHVLALLDVAPESLQLPAILLFLTIFPALVGTIATLRIRRENSGEPLAFSALFERTPLAARIGLAVLALYAFGTFVHLVVVEAPGPKGWFGSAEVGREAQRTFARVASALTVTFDALCLAALVAARRAQRPSDELGRRSSDDERTLDPSILDELEPLRSSTPRDETARPAEGARDDATPRG